VQLFGFGIGAPHDCGVLLGCDPHFPQRILPEEEVQLAPVIVPARCVLRVLEGVHGDAAGLVPGNNFCDEEAVAHVLAVVLDGVGEVEPLHPLEHLSRQRAFVLQVVEGAAEGGGAAGRAHAVKCNLRLLRMDNGDHAISSYLRCQIFSAQVLQVLDGHLSVAVSVQNLEVALDISPRGGEDAVERFVGVDDHGHHLDAVDHSIAVAVVSVQDPSGNVFGSVAVGEARVDEDCVVGALGATH